MLRRLILSVLFCAALSSPALGQGGADARLASEADSVTRAAESAGRAAARQRGVGGYFAASFLGGAPAGLFGVLAVVTSDRNSKAFRSAGAAVVIATTARAARLDREMPPLLTETLQPHGPEYADAFRAAYAQQLSRRRIRASLWGGVTGAALGAGALLWLVSSVGDF